MAQTKHLKSGSECPPLKANQLRMYGMRFCPFVHRARLVLAAKKIPYEEVFIDLSDAPDWFLEKNPLGEVPLLEWIDQDSKETRLVPESLIVSSYLDESHPNHPLQPRDPYAKATQQVLIQRFGNVISAFYGIARQQDVQKDIEELNDNLVTYENGLKGQFFGGSSPAMLDYMIWPVFHRFPMIKEKGFLFNDNGKFPKLAAWVEAMKADRAVQQTDIPLASLKRFYDGYFQGVFDYDFE